MALKLTLTFEAQTSDGTDFSESQEVVNANVGVHGAHYNKDVTTTDGTFSLNQVSVIGWVRLRNRSEPVLVTTPAAPSVANQGTAGSTSYSYKVVALQGDGTYSAASPVGSTATGNATLGATNFNRLTWAVVPGALSYDVYRTASAGTPSSTGKIGNTTAVTFDDTGLTGDTTTAPATAADNLVLLGENGTSYPNCLGGGETSVVRWNGSAIHHKANTRTVPFEVTILDKG